MKVKLKVDYLELKAGTFGELKTDPFQPDWANQVVINDKNYLIPGEMLETIAEDEDGV